MHPIVWAARYIPSGFRNHTGKQEYVQVCINKNKIQYSHERKKRTLPGVLRLEKLLRTIHTYSHGPYIDKNGRTHAHELRNFIFFKFSYANNFYEKENVDTKNYNCKLVSTRLKASCRRLAGLGFDDPKSALTNSFHWNFGAGGVGRIVRDRITDRW